MKAIRRFGFVASAALVVMAFAGASSAMAESTALCTTDQAVFNGGAYVGTNECPVANRVLQIHERTLAGAKMKLLTNISNVECDVLFTGEVISFGLLGSPLMIDGHYTYNNCSGNCVVEEVFSTDAELDVLREGHENAEAKLQMEMIVECGFFLECAYLWGQISGIAKGPLLSTELNGEVGFQEQLPTEMSGLFCPRENELDIRTTPLIATYLAR